MTPFSLRRTAVAGVLALTTVGSTLGIAAAQQAPTFDAGPDGAGLVAQQPQPPERPQPPQRPQPTEEQRQQAEQRRQEAEQRYVSLLAKHLSLDESTVKSALEQTQKDLQAARITEIQQAVSEGKLTQEQADEIIQRIQSGPPGPMMGPMGPGFGPGFGPGGPGFGPGGPGGGQRGPGGPGGPGGQGTQPGGR